MSFMEMNSSVHKQNRRSRFHQIPHLIGFSLKDLMLIGGLVGLFLFVCFTGFSLAKDLNMIAIGIRGSMNFQNAGLPPGEKEDFEQFDVFGIVGLPGGWNFSSEWEARWPHP